jgi:uncharacterized protein (TIGR02270 family)
MFKPEPLWDVVEEHLDEAEFLWDQWEHGLVAPNYTLDELADGPEARLMAHIDGLVVHGPPAATRLLLPALEAEQTARVSAAATALLLGDPHRGLDALVEVLRDLPEQRAGLLRALECAPDPRVIPRMHALLADDDDEIVAAAAGVLHFRRIPIGDSLGLLLASESSEMRALALRAAPYEREPGKHLRAIHAGLADPDPSVNAAAIEAGLHLAMPAAWVRVAARGREPGHPDALLWLALRGEPDDRAALLSALHEPSRRGAALWALGFLGTPEAVEAALEWLEDSVNGPLAGELFAAVTGVDLVDAGLTRRSADDDDSEDTLEYRPEDDLPRPDAMAVLQWWSARRRAFATGQRYLAGVPWTLPAVLQQLRVGPMRRRHALAEALVLAAPAGHGGELQTRAPTSQQFAALARIESKRPDA